MAETIAPARFEIRRAEKGWKVFHVASGLSVGPNVYRPKAEAVRVMGVLLAIDTPRLDRDWDAYQSSHDQITQGPSSYSLRQAVWAEVALLRRALETL